MTVRKYSPTVCLRCDNYVLCIFRRLYSIHYSDSFQSSFDLYMYCVWSIFEFPSLYRFFLFYSFHKTSHKADDVIFSDFEGHSSRTLLKLKTYLSTNPSHHNTSSTLDCLHDHGPARTCHASRFIFSSFFSNFSVCSVWWTKLATRQLFTAR